MRNFIFYILLLANLSLNAADVKLFVRNKPIYIHYSPQEEMVVKTAISMLKIDLKNVFGTLPSTTVRNVNTAIRIGTIDIDTTMNHAAKRIGIQVDSLRGKWEAFHIQLTEDKGIPCLYIIGSDPRGTAYGILELSRLIGVSPWCWWADSKPSPLDCFSLPLGYTNQQSPNVQYRGIFINDEDWGLNLWSYKTYDPSDQKGRIGPKTYAQIFELLLRLRANILWPAMHSCSSPFFMVKGNREMARRYGITIGTSHCEPMLCNINGEWDEKKQGAYNYLTNRDSIISYWRKRVKETADDGNFYTIGIRGKHDGPMEGTKTIGEQHTALTQVIQDQQIILNECLNKPLDKIPQLFVPYKETLDIYESGLKIPDEVTLMWCDNNYGYLTRLSNEEEQKRAGGSGIYYHVSYWGRPHDYLWLCSTQPALIYTEMKKAFDHQARKIWILNVGDIKPAEYDTELFLDLAWNIRCTSPTTIYSHLTNWITREFGQKYALTLTNVMNNYYRLAQIRRPEFMGWSRVEENGYPNRLTPVKNTDFSSEEAKERIEEYNSLQQETERIEPFIPASRKNTYYELIQYPVTGASLLNKKLLYAQLCREAIRKENPLSAETFRERSLKAFLQIDSITKKYNNLAGGKWKYIMNCHPRNLPVFQVPIFNADSSFLQPKKKYIKIQTWNANRYVEASKGTYSTDGLGISMHAMILPQGTSVTYQFSITYNGRYLLQTAMLPIAPIDGKDLRYELTIDNLPSTIVSLKTGFRDETWKKNMLSNQALYQLKLQLATGNHQLRIKALDDGIIADQFTLMESL